MVEPTIEVRLAGPAGELRNVEAIPRRALVERDGVGASTVEPCHRTDPSADEFRIGVIVFFVTVGISICPLVERRSR